MKKLMKTIEYILTDVNTDNITIADLNNINKALELSDAIIRTNIFKTEYENHSSTTALIQQINQKIAEIKQKISAKEKELEFLSVSMNKGSLTIEILNKMLNSLIEIKNDIENKDSLIITNFLETRLYDSKKTTLVKECVEALASGQVELPKYFDKPIATVIKKDCEYEPCADTINEVYEIISNRKLMEDLQRNISTRIKEEKLEKEMSLLKEILKHKQSLETILELNSEIFQITRNTSKINQEHTRLTKEIMQLKEKSQQQPKILRPFLKNKEGIRKAKQKLIQTTLDEIAKTRANNNTNCTFLTNKIDEIFKNQIGITSPLNQMRNNILSIQELVYMSQDELKEKINKINEKINQLATDYSYTTKEAEILLKRDHETCSNIIALLNAEERNDLTPVLCLYILKLLVASEESNTFYIDSKYNTEYYKQASTQAIIETNQEFSEKIRKATDVDEIIRRYPETNKIRIKKINF